jgi:hypothetical protein
MRLLSICICAMIESASTEGFPHLNTLATLFRHGNLLHGRNFVEFMERICSGYAFLRTKSDS